MPQGKVEQVPDDGLTTRQRRNRPILAVHTGEMKGKSTAAFGMAMRAWNQGWPVGSGHSSAAPRCASRSCRPTPSPAS